MNGLFFRMIIAASVRFLYTISGKRSCRRMGVPGYLCLSQSRRSDPVWGMQAARREALEVVGKGRSFPTCQAWVSRPLALFTNHITATPATAYLLATVPADVTRRAFPRHCKP